MTFEEIIQTIGKKPYYQEDAVVIYHADCRDILPQLNGVSAVVTDPPYELGFMGKSWDSKGVSFLPETWRIIRESCKHGAMLLSFGGTRTSHRIACAIEDAGWQIRDQICWVFGSGFPKSYNLGQAVEKLVTTGKARRPDRDLGGLTRDRFSGDREGRLIADTGGRLHLETLQAKLWEGYGTGLKPAYEPIIVAMNPIDGTFANNALTHGVAGLNINECRINYQSDYDKSQATPQGKVTSKEISAIGAEPDAGRDLERISFTRPELKGRFPANFIHDGSQQVMDLFPDRKSGGVVKGTELSHTGDNAIYGHWGRVANKPFSDNGSAARFFYCAKASRAERDAGLEDIPLGEPQRWNKAGKWTNDTTPARNNHPTVKPLALMTYLCKLVKMPEYNLILDPFCGSGTTLLACKKLGIRSIGIDSDEKSCEIAAKRYSQSVMR